MLRFIMYFLLIVMVLIDVKLLTIGLEPITQ